MKKIFVLLIFMFNLCSICFAQVDALERSAESGDENAQMFLAKAFYEGNGSYRIQKNVYKAQKYFKLASDHHNNSVNNLEWVTSEENIDRAKKMGLLGKTKG